MGICFKDIMKRVSSLTHLGYFYPLHFENFPMSICVKEIMKRVSSLTHLGYFYSLQKNNAVLRIYL